MSTSFSLLDRLSSYAPCFSCFSARDDDDAVSNASSADFNFGREARTALLSDQAAGADDDDAAAWGSDAVSLRSRAGRGASSRESGKRKGAGGWIWELLVGRRRPRVGAGSEGDDSGGLISGDEQADLLDEGDLLWPSSPPDTERPVVHAPHAKPAPLSSTSSYSGAPGPRFSVYQTEEEDEDEVDGPEWGAFLSAPLTSPSPLRSPSPSSRNALSPPASANARFGPSLSPNSPAALPPLPISTADLSSPIDADFGSEYARPARSRSRSKNSAYSSLSGGTSSGKVQGSSDGASEAPTEMDQDGALKDLEKEERRRARRVEKKRLRRLEKEAAASTASAVAGSDCSGPVSEPV